LAIRSGGRIELMPPPADPGCPGGNCPLPRRIAEVPAPPPDADPGRSIPYANPSDQHEAPYDGRGRPPEGLRTPRQRSSEIDKLRKYLAEREHETPALPPDDHEPPYVGPGPDDPLPKEKSPVLAFVLGALAFVGVYAVKFHKAAQAV
jgi:hypothetical protein